MIRIHAKEKAVKKPELYIHTLRKGCVLLLQAIPRAAHEPLIDLLFVCVPSTKMFSTIGAAALSSVLFRRGY